MISSKGAVVVVVVVVVFGAKPIGMEEQDVGGGSRL